MTACTLGTALTRAAAKDANCPRSFPLRGVSAESPFQVTRNSRMWSERAADATLRIPRTTFDSGFVRPRFQFAESTTASKPARWEISTSVWAAAGSCWANESSTTPTVKTRPRWLCGPGGGGILDVVTGTGEVVAVGGGAAPVVVPWDVVLWGDVVPPVVMVVPEEEPGCAPLPLPEDTITATSAPVAAR